MNVIHDCQLKVPLVELEEAKRRIMELDTLLKLERIARKRENIYGIVKGSRVYHVFEHHENGCYKNLSRCGIPQNHCYWLESPSKGIRICKRCSG